MARDIQHDTLLALPEYSGHMGCYDCGMPVVGNDARHFLPGAGWYGHEMFCPRCHAVHTGRVALRTWEALYVAGGDPMPEMVALQDMSAMYTRWIDAELALLADAGTVAGEMRGEGWRFPADDVMKLADTLYAAMGRMGEHVRAREQVAIALNAAFDAIYDADVAEQDAALCEMVAAGGAGRFPAPMRIWR